MTGLFVRLAGALGGSVTFFVIALVASTNGGLALWAAALGGLLGFAFAKRSPAADSPAGTEADAALMAALGRLDRVEHELADARRRITVLEQQMVVRAVAPAPPVVAVSEPAAAEAVAVAAAVADEAPPAAPPPNVTQPTVPARAVPAKEAAPASAPWQHPNPIASLDAPPLPIPEPALSAGGSLWRFFAGENAAVRVGVTVLLVGVAFLLKYAAEAGAFPPVLRLWSAVAVGGTLVGLGLRLRTTRRLYGLALAGGGFAALFLCIYAAQALLGLASPGAARILYVVLSAAFLVIALALREESLAVFATLGALAAPVMSRSGGTLDALLLYDLVMAVVAAVLAVTFDFRLVARLAAFATFAILAAAVASDTAMGSELTSKLALAGIAVAYGAIPVIRAFRGHDHAAPTHVFGVPIAALLTYTALVNGNTPAIAATAVGAGVIALALSAVLWRRATTVSRSELILGVGLFTYAAPLYVSAASTATFWALQGVGLVYLGARQKDPVSWALGLLLPIAGIWLAATTPAVRAADALPLLNSGFLGLAAPALGLLFASALTYRHAATAAGREPAGLLAVGALVTLGTAGVFEATAAATTGTQAAYAALAVALVGLLGERVGRAASFAAPRFAAAVAPVLLAIGAVGPFTQTVSSLGLSPLLWLVSAATCYVIVRHQRFGLFTTVGHMSATLLVGTALTLGLRTVLAGSPHLAWLAPLPWAGLLAVVAKSGHVARLLCPAEPSEDHADRLAELRRTYAVDVAGVVALVTAWLLVRSAFGVNAAPGLPYVPFVGPVDLVLIAGSVTLALALRGARPHLVDPDAPQRLAFGLGALVLGFVGTALARAVHHYGSVGWGSPMLRSTVFQASLSITYGLTGLAVMVLATRRAHRALYLFGAALLGFVVVKLIFVDLVHTGTLARIVSFMGVGVILLVVGYLVPLPPKSDTASRKPPEASP